MSTSIMRRDHNGKGTGDASPASPPVAVKVPSHYEGSRKRPPLGGYVRIVLAVAVVTVVLLIWMNSASPADDSSGRRRRSRQTFRPAATTGVEGAAWRSVHFTLPANKPYDPLSPNTSFVFPPFKDLCEWITGRRTLSVAATGEMPATVAAPDPELRAQLESAMDRFDHIAADGGAAGRRWSAATGLPLASQRTGDVKVRFVTVTNRVDGTTHFATVAAAMAGVRLDVVGKGWDHYSFVKRTKLLLSYAEREGLTDADVILSMDADAVMSGEDAESFFAAFVASTAASEEEHMTYSVRDIRTGKRQTPVLFSGEWSCWMVQAFSYDTCPHMYQRVYDLRERWVTSSNLPLQHDFNIANPFKYLNAGVMVGRVWALRRLNDAFLKFAQTARTKARGKKWWCDQTAFGGLYLDLLWWELESHAWDGPAKGIARHKWEESIFPPKRRPGRGYPPNDLLPGMIGIDQVTRLSLTIEPDMSGKGLFRINQEVINSVSDPEPVLLAALANETPVELTPMGLTRSSHRLAMTPRNYVDCTGVSSAPPECAYRDAVWGIPANASAVVPLLWHFSGGGKSDRFAHYRTVFPWYTPTLKDTVDLQRLVRVYANLPPTRVFAIDPETNNDAYLGYARVLPHRDVDDITPAEACGLSVLS